MPRRFFASAFARRRTDRSGVTAVEVALTLPVLVGIYFAMIEFGHCYMTSNLVKTAARSAARFGIANGKTNDQVVTEANRILASAIDPSKATIYIKDGSLFEDADAVPPTNYATLTDADLSTMESRDLFIVRIEVPYNSVSLFPNGFWQTYVHNITISGQAAMRHE